MTDLNTLLSDAGRDRSTQPPADTVIDADVSRGRRALARRRLRQGGTRGLVVAALAAGAFVVGQPQDGGTDVPPPAASAQPTVSAGGNEQSVAAPAIRLVAYTGVQPDGYTVGSVPEGWEIQGVDNFALVIARKGDPDQQVASFVGKLVVMLQSTDEPDRTDGKQVAVGSGTGRIVRGDGEMTADGKVTSGDPNAARLFFGDSAGHRLVVQVPAELRWSDDQIAEFGASVTASENAEPGRG